MSDSDELNLDDILNESDSDSEESPPAQQKQESLPSSDGEPEPDLVKL
jgi:hypothetical protein